MAKKPILTEEIPSGPPSVAVDATRPVDPPAAPQATRPVEAGRDASGHVRPKTRILGYGDATPTDPAAEATPEISTPAVGWLVVIRGPGRGASWTLVTGMNAIGRGDDAQVQLDFGDDSISREAHAYVTYDDEARRFYVTHGGKTNLVRLNNAPVLATEALAHGDTLRIGATALRFVALCGDDFDWSDP